MVNCGAQRITNVIDQCLKPEIITQIIITQDTCPTHATLYAISCVSLCYFSGTNDNHSFKRFVNKENQIIPQINEGVHLMMHIIIIYTIQCVCVRN